MIGIVMGSANDWDVMKAAATMLEDFGVPYEAKAMSAHRTPREVAAWAEGAAARGMKAIIAAAGGAAHLAGVVAARTTLPVLAVPIPSKHLQGLDSLLVFDNYGDVSEDIVDLFRHLAQIAVKSGAKVLVLAQESTPSYCRFYDRRAVEGGHVQEIRLRGLTVEESREMLGNPNIAEEAMRRIYLLTKGCPLYLRLIREGDVKTLKARSRFTTAEVNLLMFSRDAVS